MKIGGLVPLKRKTPKLLVDCPSVTPFDSPLGARSNSELEQQIQHLQRQQSLLYSKWQAEVAAATAAAAAAAGATFKTHLLAVPAPRSDDVCVA
jgi:hypothetical protein